MYKHLSTIGSFLSALTLPFAASAHEVYVLDPETVRTAMDTDSPNPFTAYFGNEHQFFLWGAISFVTMTTVLAASIFRIFEKRAAPFLSYIKRFAQPLVRITIGLTLIGFGLSADLFGTEMHFDELFGSLTEPMRYVFIAGGAALIAGLFTRYIAAALIAIYLYAAYVFGTYALTYTDHLGAYLFLFALGGGFLSLDHVFNMGRAPRVFKAIANMLAPYAPALLRILFGFGVMFAAVYAKFIHSELAVQTVLQYDLTKFFPFDPLFIVLGALIIEFLAGLMLFLGIAIRWTGLFLIFWLTLSQIYFQELWWVHLILFGVGLAIFCHGYDRYSLEGRLLKRGGTEPLL